MSISLVLGYPDDSQEPVLTDERLARAEAILEQLVTVDAALLQGSLDSMAVKVGDLGVDYGAHLPLLRAEGSRLLRELARVSGLALVYDKYLGRAVGSTVLNPLNVVSYW